MTGTRTDTAHLYWNAEWQKADATSPWAQPEPWVFDGPGDKAHPHYFCTAPELLALLRGFEVFTLYDRPHDNPGSWHWHLLAERLA